MSVALDELLISAASVEIVAKAGSPKVSIVAYTGGLMNVGGWGPVALDQGRLRRRFLGRLRFQPYPPVRLEYRM